MKNALKTTNKICILLMISCGLVISSDADMLYFENACIIGSLILIFFLMINYKKIEL